MPVNLSIKNVPDDLAERLRQRARSHHRSLQGELLMILKQAAQEHQEGPPTIEDLLREVEESGFRTPATSAEIVRRARDAR